MIPSPVAVRLFSSVFFGGLAIVFLGVASLMFYEVIAVWTRLVPTISVVANFEYLKHPLWWVAMACMLSFAFGALVAHFTHWNP